MKSRRQRTPNEVQDAAESGVSAPATSLPHQQQLQAAFGRHDISHLTAHMDSGSTAEMGAKHFAYGSDVVFGSSPDLYDTAHEVIHAYLQTNGVGPSGGQGTPGDAFEQQADSLAQEVMSGNSIEEMLDEIVGPDGGSGGGSTGVQMKAIQMIPVPADIQQMSLDECKELAEDIYVGDGDWNNRGILDHKIDAANDMRTDLGRSDPQSFAEKFALAALAVGVAAGSAALAAGTGPFAGAMIAGGAAVITALPGFFGGGNNVIDATTFVSNHISAMRTGWPNAVGVMRGIMINETVAQLLVTFARNMANSPAQVKQAQRNEILDAYVSATAEGRGEGTGHRDEMGDMGYGDATEGRLHLSRLTINSNWNVTLPRFANLEGVGLEKLRNYNLDRRIGDIKVPRTMNIMFTDFGSTSVGLNPSDESSLEYTGTWESRAKWALANFALERNIDANNWGWIEGAHE